MLLYNCVYCCLFFFFKQKTAYEMRISDWSSDVCSSDLTSPAGDAMARSDRTRDRSARDAAAPHLRCRGDRRRAETERVLNLTSAMTLDAPTIGRASCRERVGQYV